MYQLQSNPVLLVKYRWRWMSFSNVKNVVMVSCLKSIFYEALITRLRSYHDERSAVSKFFLFPSFFVKLYKTRLRIRYHDLDVFVFLCLCIEVNFVLPDIIARLQKSLLVSSAKQLEMCKRKMFATITQKCLSTTHTHIGKAKRKNSFTIKSSDKKAFLFLCVDFHALSVLW